MSIWQDIRKDFPITQKYTYLDHAAGGPIPAPVLEKITRFQKENAEGADFYWLDWMRQRDEARQTVADFIGAEPEEIAFVSSTSHAMNLIAELLSSEGKVLLNELEFPSSTVPWLWRNAPTVFQPGDNFQVKPEVLRGFLTPEIKTIVTSFVQYATGYRQDVEGIGKMKGERYLAVNATQGCGVFPIDVKKWNADFICTNSYKWMMAGYGGGMLYIRKPLLEKLRPQGAGWRSMVGCDLMQNKNLEMKKAGERYEWGCPSFAAIFGFAASAKYLSDLGLKEIQGRVTQLTDYAIGRLQSQKRRILSPLEPSARSGIVVFEADQPVKRWKDFLDKKIFVTPRGGGIRIAPHFYNTEEDIDRFMRVLAEQDAW